MVNDSTGPGLYRLIDSDGDDKFDRVALLRAIETSPTSQLGPHAIVLGPDKKSIYLVGGNQSRAPEQENSRIPRPWSEDRLLPALSDPSGNSKGPMFRPPSGWVCRTDPRGEKFELVCAGLRNCYDMAFGEDGELFTCDSDWQGEVGLPWYRPVRMLHLVPGADFGWRPGSAIWPDDYPDTPGAMLNIGRGSPAGMCSGAGSRFPSKYRKAMFVADWSLGRIMAMRLTPDGSSYAAEAETFVSGLALPVTDLEVNPRDGYLYFITGGEQNKSGLYRVVYQGRPEEEPASQDPPADNECAQLRDLRRRLEELGPSRDAGAVETVWRYLGHRDRHIRYAARVALEFQSTESWRDRALSEERPEFAIPALIALARAGGKSPNLRGQLLQALARLGCDVGDEGLFVDYLRAFELTFIRHGRPDAKERERCLRRLDSLYPSGDDRIDRELVEILVYLESPLVVERSMKLVARAESFQQAFAIIMALRTLPSGWSQSARRAYFTWYKTNINAAWSVGVQKRQAARGAAEPGAVGATDYSHDQLFKYDTIAGRDYIRNAREEALSRLTENERGPLADLMIEDRPTVVAATAVRPLVRQWTTSDLSPMIRDEMTGRDFEQGRKVFESSGCLTCHWFQNRGGAYGPDLTAVGNRFGASEIVESILEPSRIISQQYTATDFALSDGRIVTGRVINTIDDRMLVSTNLLDPSAITEFKHFQVEESRPSKVSLMPAGLLNTYKADEILDLIAYLKSGGNRRSQMFRQIDQSAEAVSRGSPGKG
jgi:putative heme-binding domain-containing protein